MNTNEQTGTVLKLATKIELGGGKHPKGEGFLNLDICEPADIICDLEKEIWPIPDDNIDEVYTSHFLEHIGNTKHVLHEIVRVCHLDAKVEIRVPYWLQSMAVCVEHKKTISPTQVRHWCKDFPEDWWDGSKKMLKLVRTEYIPGETFGEARDLFGWLTEDQIMRFIPDACHENRFHFVVVVNNLI